MANKAIKSSNSNNDQEIKNLDNWIASLQFDLDQERKITSQLRSKLREIKVIHSIYALSFVSITVLFSWVLR